MRRSDIDARLEELYSLLPTVECTGKCWRSCGPIDMTWRERQRIRDRGVRIPEVPDVPKVVADPYRCPALTPDRRCSVHEIRPLICRLYGVAASMPCAYGCQPNPRYLTDLEVHRLLTEAMIIGGHHLQGTMSPDEFRAHAQQRERGFDPTALHLRAFGATPRERGSR